MDFDLLLFQIDQFNCALPIEYEPYCFRAVEIISLPVESPFFQGMVDFHGSNIPVFNLRKKFSLLAEALHPRQTMIKLTTAQGNIIVIVDTIIGFTRISEVDMNPITGMEKGTLPMTASFFHENEKYLLLNMHILLSNEDFIFIDSISASTLSPIGNK